MNDYAALAEKPEEQGGKRVPVPTYQHESHVYRPGIETWSPRWQPQPIRQSHGTTNRLSDNPKIQIWRTQKFASESKDKATSCGIRMALRTGIETPVAAHQTLRVTKNKGYVGL